jgi:hypothetical protein
MLNPNRRAIKGLFDEAISQGDLQKALRATY